MTTSRLVKVAMAVNSDPMFTTRVETAFSLQGIIPSRELLMEVAWEVADNIEASGTPEEPLINTDGVPDRDIMEAVAETQIVKERRLTETALTSLSSQISQQLSTVEAKLAQFESIVDDLAPKVDTLITENKTIPVKLPA